MFEQLNLDNVFADSDFITSDGFLQRASDLGYNFLKRDFLFKSGVWRGTRIKPILSSPSKYFNQKLVIGNSDLMTNLRIVRILKLVGIAHVYGQNTFPMSGYSTSLPLGLTNDCDDSPIHRILGNTQHIMRAHQSTNFLQAYTGTIYVNFTASNNLLIRQPLLHLLQNIQNVIFGETVFSETGRVQYLSNLRSNSFVVCPEGNGVDTHRLWETLYMGGIPIVQKNNYMKSLLLELPVIQVNHWNQLSDPEFLHKEWTLIQNRAHNYESLRLQYWLDLIAAGSN
jgi:hypothetical protein